MTTDRTALLSRASSPIPARDARDGAGVGQVKSTPVTWLEPTYPLTRANAPRERAVLMRSSGCGASPRPEAFRAAGYGNRRP